MAEENGKSSSLFFEASSLTREQYDQVLVLGEAHIGKSTSIVASAAKAFGMGFVLNCGKKSGLDPAARRTSKFRGALIRTDRDMDEAIKEAKRGAKAGEYKWIVLDDYNMFATWLEQTLEDATRNTKGEPDGRRFWREYRKRLANILVRLFDAKAHFYCITHYIEIGGDNPQLIDGQTEKQGRGVAPLFGGAARKEIPGMFKDVIFMALDRKGDRIFQINPIGVYGPSCASLDGTREIPADVGALHQAFIEADKPRRNGADASREERSARR